MRRVAFFGGTFDPVHRGHLEPAACALHTFGFDALYFVPAPDPPHKPGIRLTPFAHRFAMLALATATIDAMRVTAIEAERPGPSYTFDTLRALRERIAADDTYFILGSDSFAQISTWHRWRELVDLAHLVVLHREGAWGPTLLPHVPAELTRRLEVVGDGSPVPDPAPGVARIYLLDHRPWPVSATAVRERWQRGEDATALLPPAVARYVAKYRLYDPGDDTTHGC